MCGPTPSSSTYLMYVTSAYIALIGTVVSMTQLPLSCVMPPRSGFAMGVEIHLGGECVYIWEVSVCTLLCAIWSVCVM